MKNSIAYLPKVKQNDLRFIVSEILKRMPQTEMVILYGSYARNNYVNRSLRIEFGEIPTYKVSDYDILVVTSGLDYKRVINILDNINNYFFANKDIDRDTPVQFINEDIKTLNKLISEGRYFYTQIKREGVMLYNSGNFKLARRRKLNFEEIYQQALDYFIREFESSDEFLHIAQLAYKEGYYKKAAFNLHQACENYYTTIRLTFTLGSSKQHNLEKLLNLTKKYSEDLLTVFPRNTPEEKRLFLLLKDAYVDARYNPNYKATKEDIDALMPKVELLRDITKRICEARIKEYEEIMLNARI